MVRDELVDDRSALSEPPERADPIGPHEPAVAFHVCREDCDEPTADFAKV